MLILSCSDLTQKIMAHLLEFSCGPTSAEPLSCPAFRGAHTFQRSAAMPKRLLPSARAWC